MKIGLWSQSSSLFDYKNNRDGYTYRWFALLEKFRNKNILLNTFQSCDETKQFDILIENGIQGCSHNKKYLLIIESPHVRPQDWNKNKHKEYQKVFCWDDELVDDKKYLKLNYAFDIPKTIPKQFDGKKLCCTIAGNKSANHPDELYTKRVEFIRWFEKYYPNEFDLYGTSWDQYRFGHSFLGKVLNKIKPLRKKNLFPSYKGMVDSKFETMKNYKFSICYENIKDQSGYITEKIFDSFFAGCVPIYWGAKNITEHIPKECFIDKREFDSFEEIYQFLKNMDEKTYMSYLEAIEEFLNSSKADPFRAERFADTIVGEIMKDLEG